MLRKKTKTRCKGSETSVQYSLLFGQNKSEQTRESAIGSHLLFTIFSYVFALNKQKPQKFDNTVKNEKKKFIILIIAVTHSLFLCLNQNLLLIAVTRSGLVLLLCLCHTHARWQRFHIVFTSFSRRFRVVFVSFSRSPRSFSPRSPCNLFASFASSPIHLIHSPSLTFTLTFTLFHPHFHSPSLITYIFLMPPHSPLLSQ